MPFRVFLPPLAINATSVYQELNGSVLGVQKWIAAVWWRVSKLFKLHLHVRHLGVRGQVGRHQLQLASRVGHAGPSAVGARNVSVRGSEGRWVAFTCSRTALWLSGMGLANHHTVPHHVYRCSKAAEGPRMSRLSVAWDFKVEAIESIISMASSCVYYYRWNYFNKYYRRTTIIAWINVCIIGFLSESSKLRRLPNKFNAYKSNCKNRSRIQRELNWNLWNTSGYSKGIELEYYGNMACILSHVDICNPNWNGWSITIYLFIMTSENYG